MLRKKGLSNRASLFSASIRLLFFERWNRNVKRIHFSWLMHDLICILLLSPFSKHDTFSEKGVLCREILFCSLTKYKMHFHSKCPINLLLGNSYKLLWVKSKLLALFLYGWTPNVNREGWLSARFRYLDFRAKIVKKVTRVLQYYYP